MERTTKRAFCLLLCLVMVLGLCGNAFASGDITVYCQAPDSWEQCYVYWWESSEAVGWPGEPMTQNDDGIWTGIIPDDATNVLFDAGDGNPQTGDLIAPMDDQAMYVVENGEWVIPGEPVPIIKQYYVAGTGTLCGSDWHPSDPANAMTKKDNTIWYKTYENVTPGTYEFRVTDGTWYNCWWDEVPGADVGAGNYVLVIEEVSDVTVLFQDTTERVIVEITTYPTEPVPTEPSEPTEPTYNTTRLYCQAPDDWDRCWVYWWGSSTVVGWPGMEMIRDIPGLWFYDVPSDATNVIFNNYDYGYQSADLYMPTNDNRMYLYDDQMWVSVTAEPETQGPFYVAGYAALCGSEWDENDPANRMTRRDSATWEKIYYGVAPGDYQLKVTDGTWTNCWGGNGAEFGNYEFSVVGTCDVTVVFYPESHTVYVYGDYVVLPEVPVPSDPRQIVEDAFALEPGASLPYTATLTGKVTEIVSPYSPEYRNISVNIEVEAFDGTRIIECFRLNGEGVEYLTIGDTITVSGTIERYYREYPDGYTIDKIEFYYPEFLGYGGNTPPYPAVYRVVGNADWMGNWDPANNAGRMEPVFDGYEATFLNVQPGDYELKITKNGSWTDSWGENGMNYCFTVAQPCDVTVTFKLIDDIIGIISVSGNGVTNSGGLPDCRHSYTTTLIPPTCNSEGYALHVCTLCGRSFTGGHIPMLEHVISKYTYQNNATCTENATEYGICEVCGQWIYREVENTALGHSFTEYLYNLDATCSADGTETAMCDHCRQTDTRPAPGTALEHIFEEGSCIHCGETAGLPGDVTGDGKLNILDIARLYAAIKGSGTLEANADVSGDGKINIMDVVKLYAYVKGGSPLF